MFEFEPHEMRELKEDAREAAQNLATYFDDLINAMEEKGDTNGLDLELIFEPLEEHIVSSIPHFSEDFVREAYNDALAEWGSAPTKEVLKERAERIADQRRWAREAA